jgi:hypothetical protein
MTAITITVKVSEELAHQLEIVTDIDQFASGAFAAKIKVDRVKMLEEEYCMYEAEGDTIPNDHWKHIEEWLAQVTRGELPADEYFAQRREERKKRAGLAA